MRKLTCVLSPVTCSGVANAQSSLQSQIEAVYSVQQERQAAIEAAERSRQQALMAEQRRQQMAEASYRAAQEAKARAQEAASEARRQHDQVYVDQWRSMAIQKQELDLNARRARVARENDYIDQEINRQKAETDRVQSMADSNRNLSAGARSFLEREGEADVRAAGARNSAVRTTDFR